MPLLRKRLGSQRSKSNREKIPLFDESAFRPSRLMLALEPRILYDGAVAAAAVQGFSDTGGDAPDSSDTAAQPLETAAAHTDTAPDPLDILTPPATEPQQAKSDEDVSAPQAETTASDPLQSDTTTSDAEAPGEIETGASMIEDKETLITSGDSATDSIVLPSDQEGVETLADEASGIDTEDLIARAADTDSEASLEAEETEPRYEIVYVDAAVKDYETLVSGIDPLAETVILDSEKDGIEQIAEDLEQRQDVDAVHIISHGSVGQIYVGASTLSMGTLDAYSGAVAGWADALSEKADILLYGCQVGADGEGVDFVDALAGMTGADIAASDDRTASEALGGDVELEIRTGSVEAEAVLTAETLADYNYSLATITVSNANDSGAGSLRQVIAVASAGDTITFAGGLAGQTITLTSGQLTIDKQLLIDGDINNDNAFTAANDVTISGGNSSRVFNVTGGSSGSEVELFGLRIQNGRVTGAAGAAGGAGSSGAAGDPSEGGGIRNSGHLTINQAVITGNSAIGGAGGDGSDGSDGGVGVAGGCGQRG